jgi:hypothetical protein
MRTELFSLFAVFVLVSAEQEILKPDREIPRHENLNFGIEIAQPEQVHLSYGGNLGYLTCSIYDCRRPVNSFRYLADMERYRRLFC